MSIRDTIRDRFGRANRPDHGQNQKTVYVALLFAFYLAVCLAPHVRRLSDPSLFSHDVVRIAELQTVPLRTLMVRPFNEHIAPIFEVISWGTWQIAGRQLSHAPTAFTASSLLPFCLCLVSLGILVRRELRSLTTALAAVAAFSLSAVHIEAAWWYSASSFSWALLAMLLAWVCVLNSLDNRAGAPPTNPIGWWIGGALFAMAAPACSAIGLLAGPVVALRAF